MARLRAMNRLMRTEQQSVQVAACVDTALGYFVMALVVMALVVMAYVVMAFK